MAAKLSYLNKEELSKIEEMQNEEEILNWSYYDLGSSEVPVKPTFEFTDENPIYYRPRMLPHRHSQIVEEEVRYMLEAAIIIPATSALSLPVVIASRRMERKASVFIIDC